MTAKLDEVFDKDWLRKTLDRAEKEVKSWPKWMQDATRLPPPDDGDGGSAC